METNAAAKEKKEEEEEGNNLPEISQPPNSLRIFL
jgi:hypothetical protein